MAKIISIAMQKGGTGKTTSCFNIGAILADMGYKVLLVDNDEQATLTESACLNPYELEGSISDVYLGRVEAKDVVYTTSMENLHIIPSDVYLSTVESKILSKDMSQSRFLILKHELKPLDKAYDFIIIDNNPSLGFCVINSLFAADYVLIPSSPSEKDIRALPLIYSAINDVLASKKNKKLKILGVLITKYRARVKVHEEGRKLIEENPDYRVIGIIMNSGEAETEYEGLPVSVFKKSSKVSMQYQEATKNILALIKEDNSDETK